MTGAAPTLIDSCCAFVVNVDVVKIFAVRDLSLECKAEFCASNLAVCLRLGLQVAVEVRVLRQPHLRRRPDRTQRAIIRGSDAHRGESRPFLEKAEGSASEKGPYVRTGPVRTVGGLRVAGETEDGDERRAR